MVSVFAYYVITLQGGPDLSAALGPHLGLSGLRHAGQSETIPNGTGQTHKGQRQCRADGLAPTRDGCDLPLLILGLFDRTNGACYDTITDAGLIPK